MRFSPHMPTATCKMATSSCRDAVGAAVVAEGVGDGAGGVALAEEVFLRRSYENSSFISGHGSNKQC